MWHLLLLLIASASTYKYEDYVYQTFTVNGGPAIYRTFFPLRDDIIHFKVQAEKDAQIMLATGPHADKPFFEVLIGTDFNKYIYLRRDSNTSLDSYKYVKNILSGKKYRGFWIELDYYNVDGITLDYTGWKTRKNFLKVSVGLEGQTYSIIEKIEPNPVTYNFYGITSRNQPDLWEIQEPYMIHEQKLFLNITKPAIFEGKKYIETFNAKPYEYVKFYKVVNEINHFQIRARDEVCIALSSEADISGIRYEIVITPHKVTIIHNKIALYSNDVNTFLNKEEYHNYWIGFKKNNYAFQQKVNIWVGFENAEENFINITTDDIGFEYKNFSIASAGIDKSSFWILEDTPFNYDDRVIRKQINKTTSGPFSNRFKFFPVYKNVIQFKVEAKKEAFIMLSTNPEYKENNIVVKLGEHYQIINDYSNTIYKDGLMQAKFHSTLLSQGEYRNFWIKFSNVVLHNGAKAQLIRVGRENEIGPFLAWADLNPYPIRHFGINIEGSANSWIINTKRKTSNEIEIDEDVYSSGDGHITYFPMKTEFVIFKVQATREAYIILAPNSTKTSLQYIQIQLGQNQNTESGMFLNDVEKVKIKSGLLHPTKYREFWIQCDYILHINEIEINFGRGGETVPLMKFRGPKLFHNNYIGFGTATDVNGTWSFPVNIKEKLLKVK